MALGWPLMLAWLALVPLFVVAYGAVVRRRQAAAAALGMPGRRDIGRRRHVPAALFLVAITLLLLSLSRPAVVIAVPHQEGTVILAFDASGSMLAGDLAPTRMEAARAAARGFVERQPDTVEVGVVAFSFGGVIVQQPTGESAEVVAAIDRIEPEGGTSLAEGILTALRAIAGKPIALDEAALAGDLSAVDIGYFGSAVIVLLSDGENTSDLDPVVLGQIAANAGVRIYTIGIGSEDGTIVEIDGFRVGTVLNEALLADIATTTGGTYQHAESEADLAAIYEGIDLKLVFEGEETEITSLLAAAAVVFLLVGGALAMRWFGRMP